MRRCSYKNFSLFLCCEGFLNPVSLTQRDESQRFEVQYRVSVSAGTRPLILTIFSVHSAEHFHVVRLGAVLFSLHVAVGPSKVRRVGAIVLLSKLGWATCPYLTPAHDNAAR